MRRRMIIIAAAIAVAATARAQQGTLSAAPAVVMLRGSAGQTTTQTLTLINRTTQTFAFDMVAKDVAVRDGRRVFVDPGELAGSIAATAVFSRHSVTAHPGERLSVDITVTLPPNPGARAIVALFRGTTPIAIHGISATASLGTLMTFALSSETSAVASSLEVKAPTAATNLSIVEHLVNNGTEPVLATGMLAILDPAGQLVAHQALPSKRMLPGEDAEVRGEYGGELAAGHYRALVTYDLQSSNAIVSSAEFEVR